MSYLNIKTEYSFRQVFGGIKETIAHIKKQGHSFAGIADFNSTFGHVPWQQECLANGIKPIFGVVLTVHYSEEKIRRLPESKMTFIALNMVGLREIYDLVDLAHQQFYYWPRINHMDVNSLSENVLILSGVSPDRKQLNHKNLYLQLAPNAPLSIKKIKGLTPIACCDNYYIDHGDWKTYEKFCDIRQTDKKTTDQSLLSHDDWLRLYPDNTKALKTLFDVASKIDFTIAKAPMLKSIDGEDIVELCKKGAKRLGLNIKKGEYAKRYKREMKLIKEKGYVDYFLVVGDLIRYAQKHMCVSYARGSSAGSLICYLMGITQVNPIKYNLYFERFIDINRHDLPDIDIDFQDDKRHLIIRYLKTKYGRDNVAQIGNISRLKTKSALVRFQKALGVNPNDIEELKEMDGSLEDILKTETGIEFLKANENMRDVYRVENHSLHASVHAAGILVSTRPTTDYCGINSRDKNQRIAMIDKRDAEIINLLKIDALGLRTLTIFADICEILNKPYTWIYDIPCDDNKAYKIFNKHRYAGIFQFQGESIIQLAKKMKIKNIEDISILSALGRPGALMSGGANRYIKRRAGEDDIEYLDSAKSFINCTKKTFGVIVFQEQVMRIAREYAGLSWGEVSDLRKAVSKSKGLEKFEKLFLKGCKKNGHQKQNAKAVWEDIKVHGSYSFNVSHSISYAFISYLCAWFKAHYPVEFTIANLNHTKDDSSALKFLRDMCENDKIKYKAYSKKHSVKVWTAKKRMLYGSIESINGIGSVAANKIMRAKKEGFQLSFGIQNKLDECDTPFKYLYPAKELYGEYYKKGKYKQPVREIVNVNGKATWYFIGKLIKKNIRDMNEPALLAKRNGERKESPTKFLQIIVEDDTGMIMCSIWPDKYEDLALEVAEIGRVDKSWYLIKGDITSNDFRGINITNIREITK